MLNNVRLDHLFFITNQNTFRESEQTSPFLSSKIDQPGQGTSSKRLYISNQHFDYIWLERLQESKLNPLKFHTRAASAEKGGNPFGLGFKGHLNESEKEQFWPYHPQNRDTTIWIHNSYFTSPLMPVLYVIEGEEPESSNLRPMEGVSKIEYIEMELPTDGINFSSDVVFKNSDEYFLKIFCSGTKELKFPLASCVEFICREGIKKPPFRAA